MIVKDWIQNQTLKTTYLIFRDDNNSMSTVKVMLDLLIINYIFVIRYS